MKKQAKNLIIQLAITLAAYFILDVSLGFSALAIFVGWPFVETLVTADDDLPGGWSNPDGTVPPPWGTAWFGRRQCDARCGASENGVFRMRRQVASTHIEFASCARRLKRNVSAQRMCFLGLAALILPISAMGADSICYGTPGNGRLDGGVQLAKSGANFEAYSSVGVAAGRTYVHSKVARVISDAYSALALSKPKVKFVYGESGWKNGGRIKPHRTHQNGLAVDFMVPLRNAEGQSVALPSGVWNKFGYGIEFDSKGRFEDLTIDFDAIAEHLYALHRAAGANGIGLERVIFDPVLLPKLFATRRGEFIRNNISFLKGQAWVRHDEHYHVDFAVSCKPKKD